MFKPPNSGNPNFVKQTSTSEDFVDVTNWNTEHFMSYFYSIYNQSTGNSHPRASSKHRGLMSRVVRNLENDKFKVKLYIDKFFEMGYELPSLEWFSVSLRIQEIELYIQTGTKPFFIDKKKKPIVNDEMKEQKRSGMSTDDFLKRIGGN